MVSALVVVADGSEEMEAVIVIDVLRRGEVEVTVAGLKSEDVVTCSRKVMIKPDTSLTIAMEKDYDVVVLPGGGPGAESFAASEKIGELLKKQENSGGYVTAICAGYKYSEERVVIDGKIVTSRGPGTAFEFGLAIVELLQGKEIRDKITSPMLLKF